MVMIAGIEPPPYRTPLFVDNQKILSKQWVNWLSNTIASLIAFSFDLDIESNETSSMNSSFSDDLGSLNITSGIISNNQNLNQLINDLVLLVNNNQSINLKDDNLDCINFDDSQKIQNLSDNVGILSTTQPINNVNVDTVLDNTYYRVLADSSSSAITITLPDCTACMGKEYIIYGFEYTNTITVDTTSSQQIKRISTDTAITDIINSGDVVTYVSEGTYWVANN